MTDGLALLAGVLLGLGSAALPGTAWMLVASISAALVFATPLRRRATLSRAALLLVALTLSWSGARHWLSLRVPASTADERVLFEGRIISVPAREGSELRIDVEGILAGGDTRVRVARLAWRDASVAPRVGERWRLLVRLAPLAEMHNFSGVDSARFAFRDRVHLVGRVLPSRLNLRLALAQTSVDSMRARIAARIGDEVADPDAAALLVALSVGLTDRLSADQWRVFNATGTTHLVAISGLHITLFALAAFVAARFLWRWLHQCVPWSRRIEREPFALALGLTAAGAYSLLAGFSVPTQRTWLMLACVALARLSARHAGVGRIWTLALIAVLLFDPFAPLSAGFWLSFVAVGVILAATSAGSPNATTMLERASGAVRLQLAIMLALAPLTFAVFDGLSIAGLWVNLIAIPLVSFLLVPLVLAGTLAVLVAPGLSQLAFTAAASLYEWAWPGLAWAADSEFALWRATPSHWWFAFAVLAGMVLLRRWPWVLRLPAACAALPLLFVPAAGPESGSARISIFDAGRGSAALVLTQSHALLFDTGDSWNTRGARVRQLILPRLDSLRLRAVDLLILPALSEDRALGAALLAFERPVRAVLVGGRWLTSLPVARCADSMFRWDGVEFRTYMAGPDGRYCVLQVLAGPHSILLAGDLDAEAERALASRLVSGALASEVVLVSRQGSSLGSSPEWIEETSAGLAIAAGGIADSRSRAMTLERWRQAGADILDARRVGGIELRLGTDGVRVLGVARASRYPFVWRRPQ